MLITGEGIICDFLLFCPFWALGVLKQGRIQKRLLETLFAQSLGAKWHFSFLYMQTKLLRGYSQIIGEGIYPRIGTPGIDKKITIQYS